MAKKSERAAVLIRLESIPMFRELTKEEAGDILFSLFDYRVDGVIPDYTDRSMRMLFMQLRQIIDADVERYEETCRKNAENGSKGGRAKAENRAKEGQDNDTTKEPADDSNLKKYGLPDDEMPF